jgi:hypothetical protein
MQAGCSKEDKSNHFSFFFPGEFSHPGHKKKWSNLKVSSSQFSFIFYGDGLLCAVKTIEELRISQHATMSLMSD